MVVADRRGVVSKILEGQWSRRAPQSWRSGTISMLKNACCARFFPVPNSRAEALHNPCNRE